MVGARLRMRRPILPTGFRMRTIWIIGMATLMSTSSAEEVDYETHVAPILQAHCFDCHGAETQESGLRLDLRAAILRGGESGEPAAVTGNSTSSHLIKLVSGNDPERIMPPDDDRLSGAEIKTLAAWIDSGMKMPAELSGSTRLTTDHWSFQPIRRPAEPQVREPFIQNAIDTFILKKLQQHGLSPSPPADHRTRIRRLFLVMHGLPPSPAQIEHWSHRLTTDGAAAWHELVDEVLGSPRYGERWARHWLDIIRFGETHGFETNRERPNAWHFRDYVIDAFNNDLPYNRFVIEQIAGDAVGTHAATGYLVAGPHDLVKSPDKNLTLMQRQDELSDLINVTGTTFMGLTLGCARCHNHKFDPVTQRDFYSLQAIFAGVNHGDRSLPVSPDQKKRLEVVDARIRELTALLTEFIPPAARELIMLDDDSTVDTLVRGVRHLVPRTGQGQNPAGTERGHRDDPGAADRTPNLSNGAYSWWTNTADTDVAVYQPVTRGRFRIWISWGSGHSTHTEDARYILDRDGSTQTQDDQTELAVVNQKLFADASGGVVQKSLWSGFLDCGIHDIEPRTVVFVRGGRTGTAITADVMLFESAETRNNSNTERRKTPALRPAVNARLNRERFAPTDARFVRFTIHATNSSEPCIDELEVWSGDRNVALAKYGTIPSSSSNLPGYPIHKLEHVNDGEYGNSKSWISNEKNGGWVQLEFPTSQTIERIEWARDRSGRYADRIATDYKIEVSNDGHTWSIVASSADRLPFSRKADARPAYDFTVNGEERGKTGRSWLAELESLQQQKKTLSTTRVVYAGTFSQPPPTFRLYRGDPLAPREEVRPNVPEIIGSLDLDKNEPEQQRRRQFAEWLTSPDHPLTARVIVNRLWQHQFGTGIVPTPNDFGKNGVPPSHPELIDWLASELIDNNWSLKHIHRLILNSGTWNQDHRPRPDALNIDAATRYLWRYPLRRMEAEAIRDSILTVSGSLNLKAGGPGFSGFEVEMENVRHFFPKTNFGPEDFRRMIYMTKVRQEQESVFGAFDCPDASQVISKRSRSTTPLQALNLMNSSFSVQQANLFAKRLSQSADALPDQIDLAFRLCFGRPPEPAELSAAIELSKTEGTTALCRALLNTNEFLFIP